MYRYKFPFIKNNLTTKYFDSASSSLKLNSAINAEASFYKKLGTNSDRGLYIQEEKTNNLIQNARKQIASFLNCDHDEIIFTKGTTESLNILANLLIPKLNKNDNIILTNAEHNSCFLPFYENCKKYDIKVKEIILNKENNFLINKNSLLNLIDNNTKYLIYHASSNVLGNIQNIKEINKIAHEKNVITIIDAAQYIPHQKLDFKDFGCDFVCFSGHKIYASNGIGILAYRKKLLEKTKPNIFGGGAIIGYDNNLNPSYLNAPFSFESGTKNIGGIISLAKSISFLNNHFNKIINYENKLLNYLLIKLKNINKINLINEEPKIPLISFTIDKIHPHDIASFLANKKICIRAGYHCAERLFHNLKIDSGCARISLSFYNNKNEINYLIKTLKKMLIFFNVK